MVEYDPEVQLRPQAEVTSTYSPYGAGALPSAQKPSEDWGKILGGFSKSLLALRASQIPDEKKEQTAQALVMVAEQDSKELSQKLHDIAQGGDIPAGFSPHVIEVLNKQMARKAAAELSQWAGENINMFKGEDHATVMLPGPPQNPAAFLYGETERDSAFPSEELTPSMHLERQKTEILARYPGIMGTAEGHAVFEEAYDEISTAWGKASGEAIAKGNMTRLTNNHQQSIAIAFRDSSVTGELDVDTFTKALKSLQEELRYAGAANNLPVTQGGMNRTAFGIVSTQVEAMIKGARDQSDLDQIADMMEGFRDVNPKGKNPKDAYGEAFAKEFMALDAAISYKSQAIWDTERRLGGLDGAAAREIRNLTLASKGSPWFNDLSASILDTPGGVSPKDKYTMLRDGLKENQPELTDNQVDLVMGDLVRHLDLQTRPNLGSSTEEQQDFNNSIARILADPHSSQALQREQVQYVLDNAPDSINLTGGYNAARTLDSSIANVSKLEDSVFDRIDKRTVSLRNFYEEGLTDVARSANKAGDTEIEIRDVGNGVEYQAHRSYILDQEQILQDEIRAMITDAVSSVDEATMDSLAGVVANVTGPIRDLIRERREETRSTLEAWPTPLAPGTERFSMGKVKPPSAEQIETAEEGSGGMLDVWRESIIDEGDAAVLLGAALRSPDAVQKYRDSGTAEGGWNQLWDLGKQLRKDVKALRSGPWRGLVLTEGGEVEVSEAAREWTTFDFNQSDIDTTIYTMNLAGAMHHFGFDRKLKRVGNKILDAKTGIVVQPEFYNWERFSIVGRTAFQVDHPDRKTNDAFLTEYDRLVFGGDRKNNERKPFADFDDSDWDAYKAMMKTWRKTPTGQVYSILPMTSQGEPHRFLLRQLDLWNDHYSTTTK